MVWYYHLRGRVEDLFRVLKTGGRVEKRRRQQADRWHLTITLPTVTAGRIRLMTQLGRVMANRPAEVLFTETELEMLRGQARNYRRPTIRIWRQRGYGWR